MVAQLKRKKSPPKIDIYKAWCKACGICVAFCPTGTLAKDEAGYPLVADLERCIQCGWCELRCPDFAITVGAEEQGKKRVEIESEETTSQQEEEVSPERIVTPRQ